MSINEFDVAALELVKMSEKLPQAGLGNIAVFIWTDYTGGFGKHKYAAE